MSEKTQKRVLNNCRSAKITIPIKYLKLLGIDLNEIVNVELTGKKIVISKIKNGG